MVSRSRTLPLTEVANQHGNSLEAQRAFLRRFLGPVGPLRSYNVGKRCAPEALGATGPLFPPMAGLTDSALWEYVTRQSKGDVDVRDFNWPIVEALSRNFGASPSTISRYRSFDTVPLVGTHRARLVCDALISDGGPAALFSLDPRKAHGLTDWGAFVVQSLIHHLLREQYPDLADCDIWIVRFPPTVKFLNSPIDGSQTSMLERQVIVDRLGDREPMSWSELSSGMAQTFAIYTEMLAEVAAERRRSGGGGSLP